MPSLEDMGKVIETDVLVIGGGVTGLWSSIKARGFADRVTIVDKGPRDWGGQASRSGGAMLAVGPGDNVDDFLEDLVYYYDGLCDQEVMRMILSQSYARMEDLQRLGYEFVTDVNGQLKGVPQRHLEHVKVYIGKPFGMGGKNMVGILVKEAKRLGVQRFGRIMISDLLRNKGKVVGAVGFDAINGQFYIFKARSVIVAVGNGGWKASYHHNTCAGDNVGIGLRAGAEASNCEFARVWLTPRYYAWEGQTYLMAMGAKILNAKGEKFMDKYSPVLGDNTDPHYIARAMTIEALHGNGPFYMDCTDMAPENVEMVTPKGHGWMEHNYHKLQDLGIRFFKDRSEWLAHLRYSIMGIHTDFEGRTNVPGLFAAGRARTIDPSVYSGGLSLTLCAVTGSITGEVAAKYANSQEPLAPDETEVEAFKNNLFASLGKEGIPPVEVLREIREAVFPYDVCILKNEKSLKKALTKVEGIKTELFPHMAAREPHYLMKLLEVRSIGLLSELFVRGSLKRTDSRAGHFRIDYPDRDDKNGFCWYIARQEEDKITIRREPMPLGRYKIKPTHYYSDNFTFPRVDHLLP